MSTASRVVKSLKKGDAVTVDFEIQGTGQAWCGVIEAGQTKRLGYVPCKDLERVPLRVDPFPPGQPPVVLYGSASKSADQPPATAHAPSSEDRAPDFTLRGLQGNAFTLSSLRGKVVLLDFWASWCGPCRVLMPDLERLHRELKSRGLDVVAINVDEPPEIVREFLSENHYTFTELLDPHAEVTRRYRARYIPTVVVIDTEGKVAAYYWGGPSEQDLRAVLKKAGIQ
jgi:thiol-disulfide isomerase/thioredoxin